MSSILSFFFIIPSIGLVLILLFALFRYIYREKYKEKYFEGLSNLSEANKEKYIESEKIIVNLFKIVLWISPLLIIVIPFSLYFFLRDAFLTATICMVLLVLTIWQEYSFRKWLLQFHKN
jgi:predicted histidine transporter YuiF (NhaC family)